jgi:hypothetical protein
VAERARASHHIQADTPVENVLALYDIDLRYRRSCQA